MRLRRFKLLLMTAFQNGAIMWDQSSRLISVAPLFFTDYGIEYNDIIVIQNTERASERVSVSQS